ncbi:sugar transferase, partial [Candidatus Saccharibacteria bacterium]|nr:sugar transferase [Candidatus Saccharibacteria bacterium]
MIDIVGGLVGLLIFSIPTTVAAIATRLESPGSPFFTQQRVGKGGEIFKMYKLRSMVEGAEKVLESNKEMLEEY